MYNSPISHQFVKMLPDSFRRYCSTANQSDTRLRAEFTPERACLEDVNSTSLTHPEIRMPWCGHWNASAVIARVNCGILENGQSHRATAWSIYSKYGVISAKDVDNHQSDRKKVRRGLEPGAPFTFYENLAAIGYAEYPNAHGHFANEILPRLLFLDKHLPTKIPMLWPPLNTTPHEALLREYGMLNKDRVAIRLKMEGFHVIPKNIVAKNLYFPTTSTRSGEPLCLWVLQRVLKNTWVDLMHKMHERLNITRTVPSKVIVLRRASVSKIRTLTNHDVLMEALRSLTNTTDDSVVEELEVGKKKSAEDKSISLHDAVLRLSKGRLFIAPHGAGLNNMFMLPDNATVVEIGYQHTPGSFQWPSDYLCLARNLGFHYFASLALEGDQSTPLVANVKEIVEIAIQQLGIKDNRSAQDIVSTAFQKVEQRKQ